MQLLDILGQVGGVQSIARELGISESQAASGAAALTPAILGGLKRSAQSQPGGVDGLVGMLGGLGGGGLLDDVLGAQPTNVNRGNDVLGQIFGSKDVSRAVAQNAAAKSGLDPALLKKMLPMLAMLAAGYLSRQGGARTANAGGGGALGGALGGMLGSGAGGAGGLGGAGGALGAVLGGLASGGTPARGAGGGLGALLDLDGDGNPLDDILGMVGKLGR